MQEDELDILGALNCLLRTMKETKKLSVKSLDQWPTYAAMMKKITEEGSEKIYQGETLKKFSEAKSYYQRKYSDYCSKVTTRIRTH